MFSRRALPIALLSVTLLSIELIWTRIFSAEFLYSFAFLILSSAVLGIGIGALLTRMIPMLRRAQSAGVGFLLTGLFAMASPPAVFLLDVDLSHLFLRWSSVVDVVLVILVLSSAFIAGGASLAVMFRIDPPALPRMYMADLLGAGAGVLLAIPLMNILGTPVAASVAAIPVLIAALLDLRGWRRVLPVLVIVASVPLAINSGVLLRMEREQRAPISYVHWDAMAKVKVYDYSADSKGIEIDNAANSPVYRFDGNWRRPDSLAFEFGIDVSWLMARMDSCRFLSIGAGGGVDVLQALQNGATEIHAVEVVGHINDMMKSGVLRDFSGGIYNDPRVHVVTDDARVYVRGHKGYFDLMYSLSSNTFAALASGAFAMAENYLFTTDAFVDYWNALSPRGFLMMEHQVYVPRLVSEALDALRSEGIPNPEAHIAVYNLPRMRRQILLMSKQPLDDTVRLNAVGAISPAVAGDIQLVWPSDPSRSPGLIARIVMDGWRSASDTVLFNLAPCTDDKPYIAQLGMWDIIDFDMLRSIGIREMLGFPIARIMCLIVAAAALLLLPLTLLPRLLKGGPRLPGVAWYYFLFIGMAYMAVEIMLIQKYALFLGSTVTSAGLVMVTMLVGSGFGSLWSRRVSDSVAFLLLVSFLLAEALLSIHLTTALATLPLAGRSAVAVVLLLPLSFFMGMPFPKAGVRIGGMIDWALAVNGVGAVLGSSLVLLTAFEYGMRIALMAGAGLYCAAFLLLHFDRPRKQPAGES